MSGAAVINGRNATVSLGSGSPVVVIPEESADISINDLDLVHSLDVRNIVRITQTAYDALSPPVATTLYIIVP